MKGLRIITKIVREIKFEGVCGDLESKQISRDNNLQNIETNSFSCEIAHNRKGLISDFQEFSASSSKTFILAGRLGTSPLFYGF